jgi:sporulation protein YlmC with PRC-barrel domain/ribosomal protein S18 acetylase RimI-like enzyme
LGKNLFNVSKFLIASKVIGKSVFDRHSRSLGKIHDLIVDLHSNTVDYIITEKNIPISTKLLKEEVDMEYDFRASELREILESTKEEFKLLKNQTRFSTLKKINICDDSGEIIGKINDLLFQLLRPCSILIGSRSFLNIFSSKDNFVVSSTNIRQMKENSITITQNKSNLQIDNSSGFKTILSNDKKNLKEGENKYLILEASISRIKHFLSQRKEKISRAEADLSIKELKDEKNKILQFVELFNAVLLTSPDKYIPMTEDNAKKYLTKGSFIGFKFGKMVCYCNTIVEKIENEIKGCIAGIGVLPSEREKGYSLAMTTKAITHFAKNPRIEKVQADVFAGNIASLNLFNSLGFQAIDEIYF